VSKKVAETASLEAEIGKDAECFDKMSMNGNVSVLSL
jgi:hypothetical protein